MDKTEVMNAVEMRLDMSEGLYIRNLMEKKQK